MRQHLIFDADDTLWENNIYFEEAFDRFCEHLRHSTLTAAEVRDALDEIERENSKIHGYGAVNFGRNLRQCFGQLSERGVTEDDLEHAAKLAHAILETPLELIEGVADTLAELAGRHELTMFTKGAIPEQSAKIDRSGLKLYFAHCAIVKEKNRAAYEELAEARNFRHCDTWMIGNSPKSDVNPALAAGLNAVYIPHARTWTLEREEIVEGTGKLIVLTRFPELLSYF